VDITSLSKVGRVKNLISRRIGQDGFRMNTRFMRKCTISSDVIVERDGNIDRVCNNVLEIPEGLKVIFAFDVFFVCGIHASEETAERGDTVPLADSKDGCIDVSGAGFQGSICISDSTSGIIMEMTFDIA